jgi:hypothetical protein
MADQTIHALQSLEKSLLEMRGALHEAIMGLKQSSVKSRLGFLLSPLMLLRSEIHSGNPVLAKITDLRRRSSSSSPYCFKCGEAGISPVLIATPPCALLVTFLAINPFTTNSVE